MKGATHGDRRIVGAHPGAVKKRLFLLGFTAKPVVPGARFSSCQPRRSRAQLILGGILLWCGHAAQAPACLRAARYFITVFVVAGIDPLQE
jgi:hypothetical protein